MPSQCQAAGGKSALSAAAKGSSISPNPPSFRIYLGMTVYTYIRIYECVPCVFVTLCACVVYPADLFVSLSRFSTRPSCSKFIFYNMHIEANLQSVLKRHLKAGHANDSKSRWLYQKFIHLIMHSFNAKIEKKVCCCRDSRMRLLPNPWTTGVNLWNQKQSKENVQGTSYVTPE